MPKHTRSLENYLETLDHNFTVIGISESWLKDYNVERHVLAGYNHGATTEVPAGNHLPKWRTTKQARRVSPHLTMLLCINLRHVWHRESQLHEAYVTEDSAVWPYGGLFSDGNCVPVCCLCRMKLVPIAEEVGTC